MFQAFFGFFSRPKAISPPPQQTAVMNDSLTSWVSERLKWSPTSAALLREAEDKIMSFVKKPFRLSYVELPPEVDKAGQQPLKIRTLTMGEENARTAKTPLVLLHGLGSAIGLWVPNLDALSEKNRPLYAMDILGFGLSSRPSFSLDPAEAEDQLVESVEQWRKTMDLEDFVLLGHSMGGFLASAYALKYPGNIKHLILADPWGYPQRDKNCDKLQTASYWIKFSVFVVQYFNPLTGLRAAGPWGPSLIKKLRPDIITKFAKEPEDQEVISNYLYHCNAQTPSGEAAFKTMSEGLGWAKQPMIHRIKDLRGEIPLTFIYGSRSWIDCQSGYQVKEMRSDCAGKTDVKMVHGAGHHVYADQPIVFNDIILQICGKVDNDERFLVKSCDNEKIGANAIS